MLARAFFYCYAMIRKKGCCIGPGFLCLLSIGALLSQVFVDTNEHKKGTVSYFHETAPLRSEKSGGVLGYKALGSRAGIGRGTGNAGEISVAKVLKMAVDVVKIIEMGLFFIDYGFKQLH